MKSFPLTYPYPELEAAVLAINDDNKGKTREDLLPSKQIRIIQALLNGKPAVEECTARDIFGLYWHLIYSKTKFGARLHLTVSKGLIPELSSIKTRSTSKRYRHRPQALLVAPLLPVSIGTLPYEGAANASAIQAAA
jgi:hypothetical protein